jgi:flavin-dependent dehydrogenase
MQNAYDVAIIGGGPGGSSSATYLARMGYSVVVLEKEKFPRDHVGESLIPFCYYKLKDMGVLDDVLQFATKKPGVNFVDKDGLRQSVWCFDRVIQDGAELSFHTLRAPFDKALLDHAEKTGATVLQEHTVKSCDLSDPAQVVLQVADKMQNVFPVTARFLIDASGQGSLLARKFNSKIAYKGLDRIALFTHWIKTDYDDALNGGNIKIVYLGGEKKGWLWVIPVGRNHLSIGVTLSNAYVKSRKKELGGDDWAKKLYLAEVEEAVSLNGILKNAEIEHTVQVLGDYSYYTEKKFGDNYAMVGDSGAFLDPIFSSGIYVAMETADRVSRAIDVKFRQGDAAGSEAFEKEFVDINGGYQLIEKFVRLFYDPELLNFSHVQSDPTGYQKFLSAYEIFHYLLAGDFFSDYKKYTSFLDDLEKERNYNHFIAYTKKRANEYPTEENCHYTFDQVYGHLPEREVLFPGLLAESPEAKSLN